MSRLTLFLGKPIEFNDIKIYSPTINKIEEISEQVYNIYLTFVLFKKDIVFQFLSSLKELDDKALNELKQFDVYDLFFSIDFITQYFLESFKFFVEENNITLRNNIIYVDDKELINKENYKQFIEIIKEINGITFEEKEKKFRNETARKMYEKIQKLRQKYNKDKTLELKDICSILCSAEGNGIDIFNVGNLTIYQVYEQFERLGVKENHDRLLGVWQNGLLKESNQLKDWMVKTKL